MLSRAGKKLSLTYLLLDTGHSLGVGSGRAYLCSIERICCPASYHLVLALSAQKPKLLALFRQGQADGAQDSGYHVSSTGLC